MSCVAAVLVEIKKWWVLSLIFGINKGADLHLGYTEINGANFIFEECIMLKLLGRVRFITLATVLGFICQGVLAQSNAYHEQQFSGSLISVPVPSGWVAEYQELGDVVVIGDGFSKGFLMAIGPDQVPSEYLRNTLLDMGANELVSKVRTVRLAGYDAAVVDNFGIVHEKYVALRKSGVLLIMYGTTKNEPEDLTAYLNIIVDKTRINPSDYPDSLTGRYSVEAVSDAANSTHTMPALMTISLKEQVFLNANGVYGDSGEQKKIGQTDTHKFTASWVRRGNRLIIQENNKQFVNYLITPSNEGLTLMDQNGVVSHWIRQ